jgi:hypothetical protein
VIRGPPGFALPQRLQRSGAAEADARNQGTDRLTKQPAESSDDRLIAEEVHRDFVAVTETEGDITRGQTVGSVTEKKTFRAA